MTCCGKKVPRRYTDAHLKWHGRKKRTREQFALFQEFGRDIRPATIKNLKKPGLKTVYRALVLLERAARR